MNQVTVQRAARGSLITTFGQKPNFGRQSHNKVGRKNCPMVMAASRYVSAVAILST